MDTYKTRIGPEKSTGTGKIGSVGWKKNLILIRSGKPFTSNKRPEKESGKPNRRKDQHTRCAYIMQRSRKYAWVARLLIRNHTRTPACAKMDRWRAETRAVPRVGFFFAFFSLFYSIFFGFFFSFFFGFPFFAFFYTYEIQSLHTCIKVCISSNTNFLYVYTKFVYTHTKFVYACTQTLYTWCVF